MNDLTSKNNKRKSFKTQIPFFLCSGYRVEKFNPKKGTWDKVKDVKGTKCLVEGLKEGEDYKFRVMAENDEGLSEPLETDKMMKAKNPWSK